MSTVSNTWLRTRMVYHVWSLTEYDTPNNIDSNNIKQKEWCWLNKNTNHKTNAKTNQTTEVIVICCLLCFANNTAQHITAQHITTHHININDINFNSVILSFTRLKLSVMRNSLKRQIITIDSIAFMKPCNCIMALHMSI